MLVPCKMWSLQALTILSAAAIAALPDASAREVRGLSAFVPAALHTSRGTHSRQAAERQLHGPARRRAFGTAAGARLPGLGVPGRASVPAAASRDRGALRMSLRDRDGAGEHEQMRRMAKNFLTQRAVQTLLFSLDQSGQRADFDWIEGYMGHQGLSAVHNYGALRCGWRDYLSGMLRLPEQTLTKTVEYYRGGSKGNPFLQPNTHEVTATISPRRLTATIMELRAEISGEWARDLQLIARENQAHWERHLALLVNNTGAYRLRSLARARISLALSRSLSLARALSLSLSLSPLFLFLCLCLCASTALTLNPACSRPGRADANAHAHTQTLRPCSRACWWRATRTRRCALPTMTCLRSFARMSPARR